MSVFSNNRARRTIEDNSSSGSRSVEMSRAMSVSVAVIVDCAGVMSPFLRASVANAHFLSREWLVHTSRYVEPQVTLNATQRSEHQTGYVQQCSSRRTAPPHAATRRYVEIEVVAQLMLAARPRD